MKGLERTKLNFSNENDGLLGLSHTGANGTFPAIMSKGTFLGSA